MKQDAGDVIFSQDATEDDFGKTVDDQEIKTITEEYHNDCNFNFDDI